MVYQNTIYIWSHILPVQNIPHTLNNYNKGQSLIRTYGTMYAIIKCISNLRSNYSLNQRSHKPELSLKLSTEQFFCNWSHIKSLGSTCYRGGTSARSLTRTRGVMS